MKNFKINKTNLIKTMAAFVAVGMVSCSDDYLEVPTEGKPTVDSGYFQGDNIIKPLHSSYNHLLDFSQHSFSYIGVTSITTDDANKGSAPGDTGSDKDKMENFTFDATDPSFEGLWGANYKGVAYANTGINIVTDPVNGAGEEEIDALVSEFRFFRAYHYWSLVRIFGGVPIVTEDTDPNDEETLLTRRSKEEVYEFIVADLENAAEGLPLTPPETGRVSSGTAKTLLAKVEMYRGNWQEVLKLTNEVIASGQYALHPNYEELWRIQNENTVESIFEVQGSASENLAINNFSASQSVRGQWGWGFNTPSESLDNAYRAQNDNIRREATIIYRGETMYDNDLYRNDENVSAVVSEDAPNPRYSEKMYSSPLSVNRAEQNMIVLRYADVLLMNAEANNELGNSGEALNKLNQVRSRVELPAVTTAGQAELRKTIWKERRLEFGMEFDRYFDVVRQGRGTEVFGPLGFQANKHEVFPIPQEQINLSGGLLEQNTGY